MSSHGANLQTLFITLLVVAVRPRADKVLQVNLLVVLLCLNSHFFPKPRHAPRVLAGFFGFFWAQILTIGLTLAFRPPANTFPLVCCFNQ